MKDMSIFAFALLRDATTEKGLVFLFLAPTITPPFNLAILRVQLSTNSFVVVLSLLFRFPSVFYTVPHYSNHQRVSNSR